MIRWKAQEPTKKMGGSRHLRKDTSWFRNGTIRCSQLTMVISPWPTHGGHLAMAISAEPIHPSPLTMGQLAVANSTQYMLSAIVSFTIFPLTKITFIMMNYPMRSVLWQAVPWQDGLGELAMRSCPRHTHKHTHGFFDYKGKEGEIYFQTYKILTERWTSVGAGRFLN